jgi:acyl-CoA thioester hydrolase
MSTSDTRKREARGARREAGQAKRQARGSEGRELRLRRRVQFSETDAAGIVHFSNFFRYFEDAEHELWREAGLSVHPEHSPIGWPRVAASCDFFRPLRFEQEFDIDVRITEMTTRTISYAGEITRDGERIAAASWRIACVAKLHDGSMKSTDIPEDIASHLARASRLAPRTSI